MAKEYKMNDLGYQRTPTDAVYEVEMGDGIWSFPAQIVADDRDENYMEDREDTVGLIRSGQLDQFDLDDWLNNNMNWADVSEYATMRGNDKVDHDMAFLNSEKTLVGKL